MHRIDGPGATITNQFTQGNPLTATPATVVTDSWLNAVQEEIAKVIEGAGETLNKTDNTQLLQAIQQITAASQGFTTGDVKLTLKQVADAGWIIADDGTIGSAGSTATTRANADTQDLYALLWNNVSDTWAPVTGGRGASAALDFAANKPLKLTRLLGRAIGLAGSGSGLTTRQLGEYLGAQTHTLTTSEMPGHTHANTLTDPGHVHSNTLSDPGHVHSMGLLFGGTAGGSAAGQGGTFYSTPYTNTASSTTGITINNASKVTGVTITNASQGGDGAHNNMQPTGFLNAMIKL